MTSKYPSDRGVLLPFPCSNLTFNCRYCHNLRSHAVAMARFARHCLYELYNLLNSLTNELGPGTDELAMRFGIHSGPVTAGVLRGEKSRFQLFGDTVNTGKGMWWLSSYTHVDATTKAILISFSLQLQEWNQLGHRIRFRCRNR